MGKRASDSSSRKRVSSQISQAEETHVPPLSFSEFQGITDREEFRQRAAELGIVTRLRGRWRSMGDILDEYKIKLNELEQARGSPTVESELNAGASAQPSQAAAASRLSKQSSRLASFPSLSELKAISPMQQFRDRAAELGIAIRAGRNWRSKADILADYKMKLDELERSGGAASPFSASREALSLEASHAAAPSSSSSASTEVQQPKGRTHGLASGSPHVPVPASSFLGDSSKAQQPKGRTHGLASGSPDVALSGVLANRQKRLTWKFDQESPWPSVEELEAITPMFQFQQRALQLGLPCRCPSPSGSGMVDRSKEDIVADYRLKLAELRRSGSVDPSALPSASGPASSSSSSAPNQVLAVVAPAHSQSVAEQPDWPSLAELEAITPISKFRARALELGLFYKVGGKHRRKADILSDYQQKLADMSHPSVHAGPASSSSSTAASSSLSALVSTTSPAEAPGSTHDLVRLRAMMAPGSRQQQGGEESVRADPQGYPRFVSSR